MYQRGRVYCAFIFLLGFILPGALYPYEQEIDALAASLGKDIATAGKKTIAVVDFTDLQGNVTELGRFLAEEFSSALAGAGKGFEVVDRTHLRVILQENKLSATGLIDPSTARQLGQITGVEALITGTITPFGDTVRVAVKVLDADSARVIGSVRGNIAKTQAIEELLAADVVTATGTTGDPDSHRPETKVKTRSVSSQIASNFLFELDRCELQGSGLSCLLFVTNNDADRNLAIYANDSRIIDDLGNEYPGKEVAFGREKDWAANTTLVSGIRMRAAIRFEGISLTPESIALLEISCNSQGGFKVRFRDISPKGSR